MGKMQKFALILLICLNGLVVNGTTNYRGQLVNKLIDQVTSFFSSAQMAGYCQVGMQEVVLHSTTDEIVDAVYDAAYNNMTSTQYSKCASTLMQAQSSYGSMQKVNATIQKCVAGVGPIVKDYYPEIWKKINATKGQANKLNAGYKYAANQVKVALWKKIAAGCKSKLTSDEWSKAIPLVKPYLKLENFGVSS